MSIGCFGWTVSDGFRCSEQAEVIDDEPEVFGAGGVELALFGLDVEVVFAETLEH